MTIQPKKTQLKIAEIGSIRFVATVSMKSKMFIPRINNPEMGPWESEDNELKANSGSITVRQAFFLDILNVSLMKAVETSANEIVEVKAATISKRKKRVHSVLYMRELH